MPKVKTNKKPNQEIQKQGILFNKTFGQHILKNPLVITSMIQKVMLCCLLFGLLFNVFFFRLPCDQRMSPWKLDLVRVT